MAGFDIAIDVGENVTAALARLAAAGADMTTPMMDIAGHLADTTRERFETGKGPDGKPWKPSRRVLGLDGSKHGFGPHQMSGKTLVDRGDLVSSMVEDWGRDFAAAGPEASGGAAVYAAIHQFGGTIVPRDREGKDGARPALRFGGRYLASVAIPARPYLGFTEENADYVLSALSAYVAKALTGAPAA